MPTFTELLGDKTSGVIWLLDVSLDDFATVSYRWSTASQRIDGFDYDGRIASISPIERGFGRDHLPAAATTKLRISNTDFAADWLIDRATVGSQLLRARFRLSVYLYDSRAYATAADALSGAKQSIGIFTCMNQPEAMAEAVDLTLADDSLGRLAEPLTTPTVRDWKEAAVAGFADPATNPFNTFEAKPLMDWDVPLPLVFGSGNIGTQVPAYAAVADFPEYPNPPYDHDQLFDRNLVPLVKFPIVICAAKAGTQPSGVPEIIALHATYSDAIQDACKALRGTTIEVPSSFQLREYKPAGGINYRPVQIWRPMRSTVFEKSGREWQVVWLEFNVDAYVLWFHDQFDSTADHGIQSTPEGGNAARQAILPLGTDGSPAVAAAGAIALNSRAHVMAAFGSFHVRAGARGHLSMVTTRPAEDFGISVPSMRLVDMIYDAIAYYSRASASDLDSASFERAAKARATVLGAGIIQPARPRPLLSTQRNGWISPNPRDGIVGVLRSALGEMCGSADVDLFMKKDGTYALSTIVFDYEAVTGTRTSIDEARCSKQRTKTPSQGERWAPYNRVMLQGPTGASFGPFDNQTAIDEWNITLPVTLQAKWNARLWSENSAAGASTVWAYRTLESKVRPFFSFLTDRAYLALELGDYFEATWTRGGQAAIYSDTIFRLESMRINPTTLAVELGGIWADDLATVNPYLLDDEDFLIVQDSADYGLPVYVEDGNDSITTGGSSLFTDVVAGDVIELLDATQADNVFTRFRRILITSVISDEEVVVGADTLDFDAGTPTAVATWRVLRGATHYPDSVSDPTNYPNDGDMYGKACDENNQYSDSSAANQLLEG